MAFDIFGNNRAPKGVSFVDIYSNASSTGARKRRKRTLGIRDKQILYHRAKERCEACGRKISFSEMMVGHKRAYSKGGATTLANCVCLCYKCNKLQGTDSLETLKKKLSGTYGKKRRTKSKSASVRKRKARNQPQSIVDLFRSSQKSPFGFGF
ncbi:HNH endonuclease [Candidatus Pacearchaeota archaeon]|nr:MAG: HNH endonuclease [Candidatus Pacearchaeota archaeon]